MVEHTLKDGADNVQENKDWNRGSNVEQTGVFSKLIF